MAVSPRRTATDRHSTLGVFTMSANPSPPSPNGPMNRRPEFAAAKGSVKLTVLTA